MKYKWILFDADGTLFDYDGAEREAITCTLQHFDIRVHTDTAVVYREINNTLFGKLEQGLISSDELRIKRFELLFSRFGIHFSPETFSSQYLIHLSKASHLLPGALETVSALY